MLSVLKHCSSGPVLSGAPLQMSLPATLVPCSLIIPFSIFIMMALNGMYKSTNIPPAKTVSLRSIVSNTHTCIQDQSQTMGGSMPQSQLKLCLEEEDHLNHRSVVGSFLSTNTHHMYNTVFYWVQTIDPSQRPFGGHRSIFTQFNDVTDT